MTKGTLLFLTILFFFSINFRYSFAEVTPIVVWHGMNDWCDSKDGLGYLRKLIEKSIPGVYIHCIRTGKTDTEELYNTQFMHPFKQIEIACESIQNDPKLANGYNAIGFSQGSQLIRGLVEVCPFPKAKNLISVGGQQQGVYGNPYCLPNKFISCDWIRIIQTKYTYNKLAQKYLVSTTMWHDPKKEKDYRTKNTFIAVINNENEINEAYRDRLKSLENFVLVCFEDDTVVIPKESQCFGYYKPDSTRIMQNMSETRLYKEDRIGLKYLNENNKLHMMNVPGEHLFINWMWFENNVLFRFLL